MNKQELFTYLGVTEEELAHMSIPQLPDSYYSQVERYSLDDVDSLPDNLTVGGDLGLGYTKIKELPENLTVGRILDISQTQICKIPESTIIGRGLLMDHCPIDRLPDNLEIGFLYDDNDPNRVTEIGGFNISHIGQFGWFRGMLISNCPIKQLPHGLKIKGRLDIRGMEITELPEDMEVTGLIIDQTSISKLPSHIHSLPFGLSADKSNINCLNDNMTVGGFLSLRHTPIKQLPKNLHVEGNLFLNNTQITELPADLRVDGYINIEHTEVDHLPETLKCKGIYAKDTPLGYTHKSKNSRRWAKEKYGLEIIIDGSPYSFR